MEAYMQATESRRREAQLAFTNRFVNNLPIAASSTNQGEELDECFCSVDYDRLEHVAVRTPCGHVFGRSCIRRWCNLLDGNSNKCPICRNELFSDTDMQTGQHERQRNALQETPIFMRPFFDREITRPDAVPQRRAELPEIEQLRLARVQTLDVIFREQRLDVRQALLDAEEQIIRSRELNLNERERRLAERERALELAEAALAIRERIDQLAFTDEPTQDADESADTQDRVQANRERMHRERRERRERWQRER
jgi:hypothetical protein